jgi:6-phosphofructokinase 1
VAGKRIGIINSGGDCAGLNAVIAASVKAGIPMGYEFIGFEKGWEGLLSPMKYRHLDIPSVAGISYLGGTILGTVNKGRFGAKASGGDTKKIPDEVLQEAKTNLQSIECDGLIVIGGDGTLSGAAQLAELGVKIVGVPKTIDNDLGATDRTFGFSTAVQIVVDALDRIHTTASSHGRVIFVETMGRHTGWIALRAGLAGGANAILVPEFPFRVEDFVQFLHDRRSDTGSSVVMVAEGAKIQDQIIGKTRAEGEIQLGGAANRLMDQVERLCPGEFEMRGAVLGHIQRGGTPNAADRMLSKAYGVAAINAYDRGEFNRMVCYKSLGMTTVPIAEAVGTLKRVTTDELEYTTARQLGVFIH